MKVIRRKTTVKMPALYHTTNDLMLKSRAPRPTGNVITKDHAQHLRYRARIVKRLRYTSLESLKRNPLTIYETGLATLTLTGMPILTVCGRPTGHGEGGEGLTVSQILIKYYSRLTGGRVKGWVYGRADIDRRR